ncbi:MAG: glycosyltransferase, partial [Terracidiphilus sp.]
RKGVHILVEAFKMANLKNSELAIAGGGDPRFQAVIDKINAPNTRFLGVVPNPELPPVYRSASVFVLPSFEDGFGMVVLEAMASGCPVIVSSSAGASDVVSEGSNGFIVPAGDVNAIAGHLEYLHRNPDVCVEMGRRAVDTARRMHSWANYGNKVSTVYRDLLGGKKRLAPEAQES